MGFRWVKVTLVLDVEGDMVGGLTCFFPGNPDVWPATSLFTASIHIIANSKSAGQQSTRPPATAPTSTS